MKWNPDGAPLVSRVEHVDTPEGCEERVTVEVGEPPYRVGPFGLWAVTGRAERRMTDAGRAALDATGLTRVWHDDNPMWAADGLTYYARRSPFLPVLTAWLQGARTARRLNDRAALFAWNVGLLEPHEAEHFSWRAHFSPFPWRGRKRERGSDGHLDYVRWFGGRGAA